MGLLRESSRSRLVHGRMRIEMKTFAHTGDLGDLIFSLPTIKALGGGELFFFPDRNVREPFTLNRAYNIGNLLMRQDYIRRWTLVSQPEQTFDYDFREWRQNWDGHENIAYSQAKHFGVDPAVADVPWLDVPPLPYNCRAGCEVVVMRSPRYRERAFPWHEIGQRYGKTATVLGTKGEWEELYGMYGFERYLQTPTLLEMAQVIAGAELVITNQTCGYAIAESLKKPVLLERFARCPNVDFNRPDVYAGERVIEYVNAHPAKVEPVAAPRITGTLPVAVG